MTPEPGFIGPPTGVRDAITADPNAYYEVAVPLLFAIIVVLALEAKLLQRYFGWDRDEAMNRRVLAAGASLMALFLFGLLFAGLQAGLAALAYGPNEATRDATTRALAVGGGLGLLAMVERYAESAVRAVGRWPLSVYVVSLAVLLASYTFFAWGLPSS